MDLNDVRRVMEEQLKLSRKLKARVRELETQQRPAVAVVGMAMRLPGGLNDPEEYWKFLKTDEVAVSDIPEDRPGLRAVFDPKPDQLGKSYVKQAGFLRDIANFDASFFGISQREAEAMDPQQRMLLEAGWEALERAGIGVRRTERLNVGVFVGIMASEYGDRIARGRDKRAIDPYYGTGGGHCFAAGRLSYALGFSGPAMSLDTACSSSLVALHLATQSLRSGECRYALVGGSNLILSPELMVSLCQSKALSPTGRSRTFTADADGYGRGEGVGVMVLMRLEDALRERRPILSVLRGTAVNHDGASSGLTVPSGPAQQEVIRRALQDGFIDPSEVGYVEAHGTGTALGDPIEVGALDAVVGSGAEERTEPLVVGSVKTRIGHLEAAAGVAGLMKLVLMLKNAEMPPSLGGADGELNKLIPWSELKISVPRRAQRWPATYDRRVAGISAFGLSGTNAHAVLEAYRAESEPEIKWDRPELLTLSAKDAAGLKAQVRSISDFLRTVPPSSLASACHTLRAGRGAFRHRLCVIGESAAQLVERLNQAVARQEGSAPVGGVLGVNLRILEGSEEVEQAVCLLKNTYPLLAQAVGDAELPESWLERALSTLGLRAKRVAQEEGAPPLALEWGNQTLVLLDQDATRVPSLWLEALKVLYEAGADLRLGALASPAARFLPDMPTYAFQRKRYWIAEPIESEGSGTNAVAGAENVGGKPKQGQDDIDAFIEAELKDALRCDGELDREQTFLAVGGDSFTAMLLKKSVEQEYEIEIPLEELSTEVALNELFDRLKARILASSPLVRELQEKSA